MIKISRKEYYVYYIIISDELTIKLLPHKPLIVGVLKLCLELKLLLGVNQE